MADHASVSTLSRRGAGYLAEPDFMRMFRQYLWDNTFNAETNPGGCISLAAAETVVFADLLEDSLNRLRLARPITSATFGYDRFVGNRRFCLALARFFSHFLLHMSLADAAAADPPALPLDPNAFVVTTGAGAALESLVACLCDPGDHVLILAPMYHGLENDVQKRFGGHVLAVPMRKAHTAAGRLDYEVDFAAMAAACVGRCVRAFIHCNPHNPTGKIFDEATTRALLVWCLDRQIHFVSDELYALSCFVGADTPFVSALQIRREAVSRGEPWAARCADYLHFVYSFSKDIGLNGYRTGVVYTENASLFAALDAISYFIAVPSEIQVTLTALVEDLAGMRRLFEASNRRTTALYDKYVALFNARGIATYRSGGGMFIWLDLLGAVDRRSGGGGSSAGWLARSLKEREAEVWERTLQGGVMMLPSYLFQPEADGHFRLCFTTLREEHVLEGIRRVFVSLFGPDSRL